MTTTKKDLQKEIRRLRKSEKNLKRLVYVDQLTGLGNARMRNLMLENAVGRSLRDGFDICILVLDIDRLKQVNDRLGHQRGNQLLRRTATIMKNAVREYDTVCRIGGDEFMIVIQQSSHKDAERLVSRIVKASKEKGISISAGTASMREVSNARLRDPKRIIHAMEKLADSRMYSMKKRHRRFQDLYPAAIISGIIDTIPSIKSAIPAAKKARD